MNWLRHITITSQPKQRKLQAKISLLEYVSWRAKKFLAPNDMSKPQDDIEMAAPTAEANTNSVTPTITTLPNVRIQSDWQESVRDAQKKAEADKFWISESTRESQSSSTFDDCTVQRVQEGKNDLNFKFVKHAGKFKVLNVSPIVRLRL